jgi:GTPase SAR1 family protein
MTEGSNYDYLFKVCPAANLLLQRDLTVAYQVVLIGDSGVGKS